MIIKIDISRVPAEIRDIILREIEIKAKLENQSDEARKSGEEDRNSKSDVSSHLDHHIPVHSDNDIHKIKQRMKDVLIKNRIRDYVVISDLEEKNGIVLLTRHHAERLGIHHCTQCGMEFENKMQLSVHQRVHYLI